MLAGTRPCVVLQQPLALARVASQQLLFAVHGVGNVDPEAGGDAVTERVEPLERIGVVEVRDMVEDRRRLGRQRRHIADRRAEAGGPGNGAGLLMIDHVVGRAVGDHHVGPRPPHDLHRGADGLLVEQHEEVHLFQAEVLRAEHRRAGLRLPGADSRDDLGIELGRAAVAVRRGCQDDSPAGLPQPHERASAEDLDVVGMRHQRQHARGLRGHVTLLRQSIEIPPRPRQPRRNPPRCPH